MTSVDTIAYQVLTQGGTGLNTLISGRVEFGVVDIASFKNTQACLMFRPEDGNPLGLWGNPVHERSYLFECWGGDAATNTWAGAEAVYRALHDLWHDSGQLTVAAGVMLQGYEEQSGIPIIHPETRLRYYQCRMGGKFRSTS